MTRGWHILEEETQVTLCRHLPPRFDFCVQAKLPGGAPKRLASQIRQDMWRTLQGLRGFSPVVQLQRDVDGADGSMEVGGWTVHAGGRLDGPVTQSTLTALESVLSDPKRRTRWLRCAGYRGGEQ